MQQTRCNVITSAGAVEVCNGGGAYDYAQAAVLAGKRQQP
jgi:hypothetical protein